MQFAVLKAYLYLEALLSQPLRRNDRGATAVEYGLIVALIAAVIIVVVAFLGQQVKTAFCDVTNAMGAAGNNITNGCP